MESGFNLEPDEHVIRIVRRHWIDLFPVIAASVLLVLSIPAMAFLNSFSLDKVILPVGMTLLLFVVIIGIALIILLLGIFVYRQNYLILTNMHIIQVEQRGMFNRQVSQLSLVRVQDVSGKRAGVLATALNYGNVEVQSAGEHEKFIFRNAASPQELADHCLRAHEAYMHEHNLDINSAQN